MIKPINISPINTTQELTYECMKCKTRGTIYLENSIVNTDSNGNPEQPLVDYNCPKCGEELF